MGKISVFLFFLFVTCEIYGQRNALANRLPGDDSTKVVYKEPQPRYPYGRTFNLSTMPAPHYRFNKANYYKDTLCYRGKKLVVVNPSLVSFPEEGFGGPPLPRKPEAHTWISEHYPVNKFCYEIEQDSFFIRRAYPDIVLLMPPGLISLEQCAKRWKKQLSYDERKRRFFDNSVSASHEEPVYAFDPERTIVDYIHNTYVTKILYVFTVENGLVVSTEIWELPDKKFDDMAKLSAFITEKVNWNLVERAYERFFVGVDILKGGKVEPIICSEEYRPLAVHLKDIFGRIPDGYLGMYMGTMYLHKHAEPHQLGTLRDFFLDAGQPVAGNTYEVILDNLKRKAIVSIAQGKIPFSETNE